MAQAFFNSHMMLWRHFWFFWMHFASEGSFFFLFWKHMFGSKGCLKADVVPGCIFFTNYLFIIGHYSRTERRAVQTSGNHHEVSRLADSLVTGIQIPCWVDLLPGEDAQLEVCTQKKHTSACGLKFTGFFSQKSGGLSFMPYEVTFNNQCVNYRRKC